MAEQVLESSGSVGPSLVPTILGLSALVAPGPAISPFAAAAGAAGAAAVPVESAAATSADSEGAITAESVTQPHEEMLSFSIIETAELQQLTQRLSDVSARCRQQEVEAAAKDEELIRLRKLTSILQDDIDDLIEDRQLLDKIMANNKPVAIDSLQERLQVESKSPMTDPHTRQLLLEADQLLEKLAEKQKGIGVFRGQLEDIRRRYRWAVNTINEHNAAAAAPGEVVHSWPICRISMPGTCCEHAKRLDAKLRVRHQNPEWQLAALRKEYAAAQQKHAAALQEATTAGFLQVSALCTSARNRQYEDMYKSAVARRSMEQQAKSTEAYRSGLHGFAVASMMVPVVESQMQEELAAAQMTIVQLKQDLTDAEAEMGAW